MDDGNLKRLTHLDDQGRARMVDVAGKPPTRRRAVAQASVCMDPNTKQLMMSDRLPKGDVFPVARVAGIMAAKRTPELIPLCHTISLTSVNIDFEWDEPARDDLARLLVKAVVETVDRTGVEMEALVAVSVAALTIYDMCKAVDPGMWIESTWLVEKAGGKSGHYHRPREETRP